MPTKTTATRRRGVKSLRPPAKVIRKANRNRPPSGLERAIHAILKDEGIKFIKEKTIGRLHVDVLIGSKDVVELNGCYWHACSKCTKTLSKMHRTALETDARRYAFLKRLGFNVHIVWEHELENTPDQVRTKLKKIAGV